MRVLPCLRLMSAFLSRYLTTAIAIHRYDQGTRAAPSCFRTAAAELPTLSIARANSSLVTPKCRVQYLTWSSRSKTILLRSGVIVLLIIFAGRAI